MITLENINAQIAQLLSERKTDSSKISQRHNDMLLSELKKN